MSLLSLSWTFFYIGLFTIGGGQVAITLMYQPIVEGGLLTAAEFYNMLAVSESTPGPIGINMATYIGCRLYGVLGGVVTTFSTVLPSLIIILFIAKYFEKYRDVKIVQTVLSFVRPVSAAFVAVAAWQVFRISLIDTEALAATRSLFAALSRARIAFYALSVFLLFKTKLSPIAVIVLGALFGVLFL